jgi:UPF0755 protein
MKAFAVFIFTLLLMASILALGALGYGVYALHKPHDSLNEPKIVMIEPGTSVRQIGENLEAEGAISNEYIFIFAVKLMGASLQAGEYEIKPKATMKDVIDLFKSGKVYQRKITFAEGLTSFEIVSLLKDIPYLKGEIIDIPAEGVLLPDTYHYTYGTDRNDILKRMQKAHDDLLADLWARRVPNLPLKTPAEAATLASIVEKETAVADERPRVAGVFINRLRKGMMLQTDPTVIYAITKGQGKLDRPLLFKDLEVNSPYNTYKVTGLPPTPIANAGKASLMAVLINPEVHDYLFFVADGTGGHAFAQTYDQHNENVKKWREIQRSLNMKKD